MSQVFKEGDNELIQACRNRLPEPTRTECDEVCTLKTLEPLVWKKDEIGLYQPDPKDCWHSRVTFKKARISNGEVSFFAWVCQEDNKIYF